MISSYKGKSKVFQTWQLLRILVFSTMSLWPNPSMQKHGQHHYVKLKVINQIIDILTYSIKKIHQWVLVCIYGHNITSIQASNKFVINIENKFKDHVLEHTKMMLLKRENATREKTIVLLSGQYKKGPHWQRIRGSCRNTLYRVLNEGKNQRSFMLHSNRNVFIVKFQLKHLISSQQQKCCEYCFYDWIFLL